MKAQECMLLQQEKDKFFAELKESHVEVSRVTESKDDLKRSMTRLKTSHAKELDKLHKRLRGANENDCINCIFSFVFMCIRQLQLSTIDNPKILFHCDTQVLFTVSGKISK